MGKLSLALAAILVLLALQPTQGSELNFKFHSPSFSGVGKSSHYLTIENIEKTRKDAIKAADKAAKEKAEGQAHPEAEESPTFGQEHLQDQGDLRHRHARSQRTRRHGHQPGGRYRCSLHGRHGRHR